ncbi:hypothetical protein ACWD6L_20700 [Micromonospora profundi]|uniref:hypothetical protein n=1 Tax=Micromonospora profundi TaxID=1420889 RepID=UPI00143C81E6|nr:hypothetical protein [Micromonospora profundi]NJC10362.1 hypothetical protein [Micromonospora profundi]
MTDLDQQITRTLRQRAEGDVDIDQLLHTSRARGRRRQAHRRVAAGTALSLIGALGVVGVTGTGLNGLTGRMPWTTAAPTPTVVPPRADGVPGAAADPALVGADPQVLHVGVDPDRARYLGWEVIRDQVETVRLSVAGSEEVRIDVGRSIEFPSSVTIDGASFEVTEPGRPNFDGAVRPASGMARGLVKLWQPVPGLYARAVMLHGDRAVLNQAVGALRWKEARRCAAPLRLGALPEGARVTVCSVDIASYPRLVTARFALQRSPVENMSVEYRYASRAGTYTEADRTIAGRPALLSAKGTRLELVGIPRTRLTADFGWPWDGERPANIFTEAEATALLAQVKLSEDPTKPRSWE